MRPRKAKRDWGRETLALLIATAMGCVLLNLGYQVLCLLSDNHTNYWYNHRNR